MNNNNEDINIIRILFLSADPTVASRLRLGQELRDIREQLQLSRNRNRFFLESRECVRPHDISQYIFDFEPHIIHFAGHCTNAGELCFEDISGDVNPIKPDALAELFELLTRNINCIVLNACYSAKQAKAIAQHIPYVVGMSKAIQDKAAITFAVGFYKAVGAGKTIDEAFKFGKVELKLLGIAEDIIPILHKKKQKKPQKSIDYTPQKNAPKIVITITGDPSDLNDKFLTNLLANFREMSNDVSLKIDKIESGSIKITLSGVSEGLERLAALLKSDEITEKLGIYVKEVKLLHVSNTTSSRYWKIWRISLKSESVGYEYCLVPTAQEFVKKVANSHSEDIQAALLHYFHNTKTVDPTSRAEAGLCLRCYVSDPILKACQKIDHLFGSEKQFTYQDLLPFVLNDDGQTLVILDSDRRNQLILSSNGEAKTSAYKFFSVNILQTFRSDSQPRMSLDNWAYLQTKQNPELKDFLSEYGFQHLSDWALLNRARPKQLERLSVRDRHLVEVFHAVYRRDRRMQRSSSARKCPDPSSAQLQEMLKSLQFANVKLNSTVVLMKELKQVAILLRQYDIWSYREPLEIQDPDTGIYTVRADLLTDSFNELDVEQREFLEFLHSQLSLALTGAITQEIGARITWLQKSHKYAILAQQLIPGLQLYYSQGMSLRDIAPILGMTSWDQARRVLNPGELLSKVRTLTVQQLLDSILEKAVEMGLTTLPPEPNYLQTLAEQIEAFADAEIFQQAAEEIRAGRNRSMNSAYAQQLRIYLEEHQ